jgi:hypothetical protein
VNAERDGGGQGKGEQSSNPSWRHPRDGGSVRDHPRPPFHVGRQLRRRLNLGQSETHLFLIYSFDSES